MAIRDDDLDRGLFEAFQAPPGESALQAIQRLHGAGSSLLLRDAEGDPTPVLLRRGRDRVEDDPRYRILGEIARGGIGVIYKAHDQDLNRDVALKVLRAEYRDREDVIQRFVEEAQVEGQLQHPGIVPIYGLALQPDGRPSFVMKLIKGRTLAELLAGNADGIDLLAVFEQVAQTVAYAHSRGVIHRDLKPANVMVGAFGEVQVVDWGFAKVLGHDEVAAADSALTVVTTVRSEDGGSQSVAGSVMGTPAYMPPEQAMGRSDELDERSDVFALGAILCEVLTGTPPYVGEQKDQLVAAAQCRLEPALHRLDAADASRELVQLARDCLQPLAGDRPRDAGELAERLAAHFASVEERARQAQLDAVAAESRAAHERYRRRRALMLAAATVVAILSGGGGYLWWQGERSAREAAFRPQVAAALRAAKGHEGQGNWSAAIAAAGDAVAIATSAGITDGGAAAMVADLERRQQAAAAEAALRAADAALLDELEEARALAWNHYPKREIDAAYVAAVTKRWPDGDVDTARLRASPRREQFSAAFDSWAVIRRRSHAFAEAAWREVDAWARAIDPSRDELRDAVETGDFDALEAIAAEQDPAALAPTRASYIAQALVLAGRVEAARVLMSRAWLLHPGSFSVNLRLGEALSVLGEREGAADDQRAAMAHLRAAIALRPESVEPRHLLAIAAARAGDVDGAVTSLRDAIALRPDWSHGYHHVVDMLAERGRQAEAVAILTEEVARQPDWPDGHYYLGRALWRSGRNAAAIAEYRTAIGLAGQDARLVGRCHGNIGLAQRGSDPAAAFESLRRAVELVPEESDFRVQMVQVGRQIGRPPRALDRIRQLLARDPTDWGAWYELHDARTARGDFENGLDALRNALRLAASSSAGMPIAAYLCDRLARYDEAVAEFDRVIVTHAEDHRLLAEAHANKGIPLRQLRRFDEAAASIRRGIELDPDNAWNHRALGVALEEGGHFAQALAAYRAAARHGYGPAAQGDITRIRHFLAWQERLPGQLAELPSDLSADDLGGLGVMLLHLGRCDEAVRCFRRAFDGAPQLAHWPHEYAYKAVRAAARAPGEEAIALTWIRALLADLRQHWRENPAGVMRDLRYMRADPDLAAIRDAEDLRAALRGYWAAHDALIDRIVEEARK